MHSVYQAVKISSSINHYIQQLTTYRITTDKLYIIDFTISVYRPYFQVPVDWVGLRLTDNVTHIETLNATQNVYIR
jgi:hypothetical protein